MNFASNSYCKTVSNKESVALKFNSTVALKYSREFERKVLKVYLLAQLHQVFSELLQNKTQCNQNDFSKEAYAMDSKIIQYLIQKIVETGEYTMEGIAYHTRIPFDVIYDAARGINNQLTITPWLKIVSLYLQIKPDVAQILANKLIENHTILPSLLNDP